QYTSDISGHIVDPRKTHNKKLSFQVDNTWLWLPEKLSLTEQAVVSFELPGDYQVSTPWRPLDKQYRKFLVGRSPHDWGMTLIIGEFDNHFYKSKDDSILNIVLLGELKQKDNLIEWIRQTERALVDFLGKHPLPMIQVVLIENRRFRKSPVPWGEVNRGGGIGIRFVVDSSQPIDNFYQDWTATHEFSHLLAPKIDYRDSWLSEGLASYLQYLLMAQAGNIPSELAWQKLYEGLMRGAKGTKDVGPEILRDVVENRRKKGSWRSGRTMRIYWSGAAYFLLADWQLRKTSKNKLGLAQVLAKFNQCCVLSGKEWGGKELSEKLDELSKTSIFSELYQEIAYSESFPNIQPALDGLGIKVVADKVVLTEHQGHQYRDSILTPLVNIDN
ncbi:MAG: hypothetical protein OQJ89_05835, partial [Kangiellaceae bacterium]|nr:hypothetical protein [Kangiellaceae bacterium]